MAGAGGINIYTAHTLTSNWFADRYEPEWQDEENATKHMVRQPISRWKTMSSNYGANVPMTKPSELPNVNWLQYDKRCPRYETTCKDSFKVPEDQRPPFEKPRFAAGEEALQKYQDLWTHGEKLMFKHYDK
eukprot:GEMP01052983.1.p1 GENE.GEMP01052983.1~~GEMP01052983.1.p1  ORF type:complete len:131 (+),score=25.66 GEMP01052983.1:103-495(+)